MQRVQALVGRAYRGASVEGIADADQTLGGQAAWCDMEGGHRNCMEWVWGYWHAGDGCDGRGEWVDQKGSGGEAR